jgi:enterochelin esterase family protein
LNYKKPADRLMRRYSLLPRLAVFTICIFLIALSAPSSQFASNDSFSSSVGIKTRQLPDGELCLPALASETLQSKAESAGSTDSPRLAALLQEVKAGNRAAVQQFWEDSRGKIPLVEAIPGNKQLLRVTFVWRGDDEVCGVKLVGSLPLDVREKPLNRLADTDVWFLSSRIPTTARLSYGFVRADETKAVADPLNPTSSGGLSLIELPGAFPQPWARVQPSAPKGTMKQDRIRSEILKEERTVSIYTPAGYNQQGRPYGLLIMFDGEAYQSLVPTPTILDNLVAGKKIKPLVAILVHSVSQTLRSRDLQCSALFADFLAKELVPWARRRYGLSTDPKQTIVGGSSYGGLSAAYCAFLYPGVFGNVLSQSGSFGYYPGWYGGDRTDTSPYGWLIRQFVRTRKLPIRFYLEAGLFEAGAPGNILSENRRMRDVLEAKGYSVVYSEFPGGHEYLNWRGSLADGLIALDGRER